MSHWAREIAGWLLIAIGLIAFYQAYDMLLRKRIFEAMPMVFVGFIIFRGGIHLLKVAVAAQAARGLREAVRPVPKRAAPAARSFGPTAMTNVLPGPQHTAAGRSRE